MLTLAVTPCAQEVLITGTMDEKYLTSKLMKWSKASSKEVKLVETTPAQA